MEAPAFCAVAARAVALTDRCFAMLPLLSSIREVYGAFETFNVLTTFASSGHRPRHSAFPPRRLRARVQGAHHLRVQRRETHAGHLRQRLRVGVGRQSPRPTRCGRLPTQRLPSQSRAAVVQALRGTRRRPQPLACALCRWQRVVVGAGRRRPPGSRRATQVTRQRWLGRQGGREAAHTKESMFPYLSNLTLLQLLLARAGRGSAARHIVDIRGAGAERVCVRQRQRVSAASSADFLIW